MDESTTSKKDDPETIAMLWWILIAIILVSIPYVIPSRSTSFWVPLNAAGLVTGVYLLALVIYLLRKPLRLSRRPLLGIIAFLVIGVAAYAWVSAERGAKEVAELRYQRRVAIARGALVREMSWRLTETLTAYFHKDTRGLKTLAQSFLRRHPKAMVGSDIRLPLLGGDRKILVQTLEPRRIALVGLETTLLGRDSTFKNYDGTIGRVQEKLILTERGIIRESEN